ncbi:hypothetical protein ACSNN9_18670, partial [Micromonospora sp. URMC 107]
MGSAPLLAVLGHPALDRLPDAPAGLPQRLPRLLGELGRARRTPTASAGGLGLSALPALGGAARRLPLAGPGPAGSASATLAADLAGRAAAPGSADPLTARLLRALFRTPLCTLLRATRPRPALVATTRPLPDLLAVRPLRAALRATRPRPALLATTRPLPDLLAVRP